jgi:GAF domain-containing protein
MGANGEQRGTISLGPRSNGLDYTPADRQTLQDIVDLVAQAIELSERNSTVG